MTAVLCISKYPAGVITFQLIPALYNIISNTLSIPVEGSYTQGVQKGISVLEPDLEVNKEVLRQYNK